MADTFVANKQRHQVVGRKKDCLRNIFKKNSLYFEANARKIFLREKILINIRPVSKLRTREKSIAIGYLVVQCNLLRLEGPKNDDETVDDESYRNY
jgi:hypothetical protein